MLGDNVKLKSFCFKFQGKIALFSVDNKTLPRSFSEISRGTWLI